MKSVESIKGKLKYRSRITKRLYSEILTMFLIERFIYRISISNYKGNFILKGGVLLYAIYNKEYPRATADIDLLSKGIKNDVDKIKKVFQDIIGIDYRNDFVTYDLESLDLSGLTKGDFYTGVKVTVESYLGKSKQKISIDIGFGDIVKPEVLQMEFPTILDLETPKINVYSKESIIAEKFEAIVSLGELNSRYKDYFDIYTLLNTTDFNYNAILGAIKATFDQRKTSLDYIILYDDEYINNPTRRRFWNSMIKKRGIKQEISFIECGRMIRDFVKPIVNELKEKRASSFKKWSHKNKKWI